MAMGVDLVLLYGSLLLSIVGAQLTLTSDPDTNGSYCPGRVTFTCNGTNVANGLEWVLNGMGYNLFTLTPRDSDFPRKISSDTSSITIRVMSASVVENSRGINIVSVLSVESLNHILDNTVSCQTIFGPSSQYVVGEKDIDPGNVAVDGIDDDDDDIVIRWNITNSQCEGRVYRFRVMLIFSRTLQLFVNCSSECVARFRQSPNVDQYMAEVQSINSQGQLVGTPATIYFGGDGMVIPPSISHEIETSACEATFMCTSSINGSCVIELIRNNERFSRSGAINSSIAFSNLLPNSFYSYGINFTNLQGGVSNYNFTTGSCSSSASTTVIVGVVVPVVILALVLVPIIIIIIILVKMRDKRLIKNKTETDHQMEYWEKKDAVAVLTPNKHGELVDEEGIAPTAFLSTSGHRCIGESVETATKRLPEERLQHMRNLREDLDPLVKKDTHVYDTTQFPNATSAGQSEANEAVSEEYDRIKTNDDEYDRLRDHNKKKNTKPPKQDGSPVVYSDLNPTEKEDPNRLTDRNNTSISKPKDNKKRNEHRNT